MPDRRIPERLYVRDVCEMGYIRARPEEGREGDGQTLRRSITVSEVIGRLVRKVLA